MAFIPLPQDNHEPTNEWLWEQVIKLVRGDRRTLRYQDKEIQGPHHGHGWRHWPAPKGVAWAVKQYNNLGGGWRNKKEKKEKKASLAERVAARFVSFEYRHPVVQKYQDHLTLLGLKVDLNGNNIYILPTDPAESAKLPREEGEGIPVDSGAVGQLTVSRMLHDSSLTPECLTDLQALRKKVRKKNLGIQSVSWVRIRGPWKSKGLGNILYEIALYNAANGYGTGSTAALIPSSCTDSPTSGDADRVWVSLARRFPSVGHIVFYGK